MTYLVFWSNYNGIQRVSEFTNDIMGAVTLCEWLRESHIDIVYTLGWVDENNIRHDGCEAIEYHLVQK